MGKPGQRVGSDERLHKKNRPLSVSKKLKDLIRLCGMTYVLISPFHLIHPADAPWPGWKPAERCGPQPEQNAQGRYLAVDGSTERMTPLTMI